MVMGQTWQCCSKTYLAQRHTYADIPQLICNSPNLSSYSWSLTNWALNGVYLDPEVYHQDGPYCIIYAFFAACDILRLIRGSTFGWTEPANFCLDRMLKVFKHVTGIEYESWSLLPIAQFEFVLMAAFVGGVPYRASKYDGHRIYLDASSKKSLCTP